ncbi:hypothetical protein [Butyrivibrio sp. VCB2006]|uniref:hypothetical protein n=1 Tax=Butyrivibrio sp. VCB2006 TaxID=1280679 RepID=UPI00040973B6|nr:hypothetical protein [Butyrivibrio sp. VCB2006]
MEENFNESKDNEIKNNDTLAELLKLTKKQLFFQRIAAVSLAGVFVVVAIAMLIMIPRVTTTLSHINSVAVKAEASLDKVDTMTSDISGSAQNFDKLLNDNGKKLTDAVTSISEIDFEGLNTAIKDLQDAVGPMATFMNRFR